MLLLAYPLATRVRVEISPDIVQAASSVRGHGRRRRASRSQAPGHPRRRLEDVHQVERIDLENERRRACFGLAMDGDCCAVK